MRIIETKVYTYAELSDDAKAKARDWWREASAGDTFWAECVTDDFHDALKALGFDPYQYTGRYLAANDPRAKRSTVTWSGFWSQGDGAAFGGTWCASDFAPDALLADRPVTYGNPVQESASNKELHRIAAEIRACKDAGLTFARIDVSNRGFFMSLDSCDLDEETDDAIDNEPRKELEDRFIEAARDLATMFYRALEAEYEYQYSDEQVAESLEANGYEFTEEGKIA